MRKNIKNKINLKILILIIIVYALALSERYGEAIHLFNIYLFSFVILIVFPFFLIIGLRKRENFEIPFSVILLLFTFMVLIIPSSFRYGSIKETYKIITPLLLFLIFYNSIKNEQGLKLFLELYTTSGVVFVFINYINYQFFSISTRLFSLWSYPNTFGAFIATIVFPIIILIMGAKNKEIKMFLEFIGMFLLFVLFLTVSRGAYIALLIGIIFVIVLLPKERLKPFLKELLLIIGGSAVIIAIAAPRDVIYMNFGKSKVLVQYVSGTSSNMSLWRRVHFADLSLKIFKRFPLFGTGAGTFRTDFCRFEWMTDVSYRLGPHSLFFRLLAETGLLGVVSFFGIIFLLMIKALKKYFHGNIIGIAIFGSVVSLFAHMQLDIDAYYMIPFIILFSLSGALLYYRKTEGTSVTIKNKKAYFLLFLLLPVLIVNSGVKLTSSYYALNFVKRNNSTDIVKAMKIDYGNPIYPYYLARSKTYDNKIALEMYLKSVSLNKYDYRYAEGAGLCYAADGNYEKSIEWLENAEKLYPTDPSINGYLSIVCLMNGNLKKAKEYSDKSIEMNIRNDSVTLFSQGMLYLSSKDYRSALNVFSQYNETNLIRMFSNKITEEECRLMFDIFETYSENNKIPAEIRKDIINEIKCPSL